MPGGLGDLIDARRELLQDLDRHPERAEIEAHLFRLLRSVLNHGDLRLQRIDSHAPDALLEKIVQYEAVHRIRDPRDLERRLAEDRRCYAFFHPALPDEPLIFTELALTDTMSADADALLDLESPVADPSTCSCAIFYSISSCHEGLKGVSLGNALIGQVADELARRFPRLRTFATLSPVPGFRSWLATLAPEGPSGALGAQAALALGRLERSGPQELETSDELKRQLLPLCAYYLLHVRRGGEPVDPVARFHLRNGASLERINWLSDTSTGGMRQSLGLMVNYLYRCTRPRHRYEASMRTGSVNASRDVKRLADRASTG